MGPRLARVVLNKADGWAEQEEGRTGLGPSIKLGKVVPAVLGCAGLARIS